MNKIPKPPGFDDRLKLIRSEKYLNIMLQRQALRRGLSVEEYSKIIEKKNANTTKALDITQEKIEEIRKNLRESTWPGPECIEPYEAETYTRTGKLPQNRLSHLEACHTCRAWLDVDRQCYLIFNAKPLPECLTKDELHAVHTKGKIGEERKKHTENCERCKRHYDIHFEMYLDKVLPYPSR